MAAVLHLHFVRAGRCAARPTGVPERRELGLLFHPPCFATSFYRNAFLSSLIIARSPLSCSCFAIRLCAGISFDRIGSENFLSNFLSAKIHRNLRFVKDSSFFLNFITNINIFPSDRIKELSQIVANQDQEYFKQFFQKVKFYFEWKGLRQRYKNWIQSY